MIIAKWRKGTYKKDKTGTEIAEHFIRVQEVSATRYDAFPTDGVTAHDWTLVLESDTPSARNIEAGDMIIFNKHRYTVQNTATRRNRNAYNSFNTLLYLK